jgi:HTH-type transcriptional regulator/antitoxin HigA
MTVNEPRPAEMSPPGVYIRMELEARGWSQVDLAQILGRAVQTVSDIVNGKRSITPETASGLAAAFGTTAQVWMNLQTSYDLWRAAGDRGTEDVSRRARLYELAPVAQMVKRGWIEGSDSIEVLEQRVRDFLGIPSLDEKPTPLRYAARGPGGRQTEAPSTALQAWRLRAKRLAPAVSVKPFRKDSLKKVLEQFSVIRHSPEELRQVPRILAEGGIRLIIIEPLPRMKVDGGSFWLDDESPVVVLSLRYDRIDWFWHTLMHELVHIERRDGEQWDDLSEESIEERPEAERVVEDRAADYLVAKKDLDGFIARTRPLYSKEKIRRFAARVGVHPGIVVGQLQHKKEVSWSHDREMLVRVRDIVADSALTDGWGHTLPVGL